MLKLTFMPSISKRIDWSIDIPFVSMADEVQRLSGVRTCSGRSALESEERKRSVAQNSKNYRKFNYLRICTVWLEYRDVLYR